MGPVALKVTSDLIERVNNIQSSPHFVDPTVVSDESRAWRLLKKDVEKLFQTDARDAWELMGMCHALTGDRDGMEEGFRKSLALGTSSSNLLNLMVNRLNVGLFSKAQEVFAEVGIPEAGQFSMMIRDGFMAGAFQAAAQFDERAREMAIERDEALSADMQKAASILRDAGISDEQVARHLDVAGNVLLRHRVRVQGLPLVTAAPGFFEAVTYMLPVPVSAEEAFEMNVELAQAEDEAGIQKDVHFDVVFGAHTE